MTRPIRPPDGLLVEALTHAKIRRDEMDADPASRDPACWDAADWMAMALVELCSNGEPERRRLVCSIIEGNELLRSKLEHAEHERERAIDEHAESEAALLAERADHIREAQALSRALEEQIVLHQRTLADLRVLARYPWWRPGLRTLIKELAGRIEYSVGGRPTSLAESVWARIRAEEAAP